jgi:hypothetical protein
MAQLGAGLFERGVSDGDRDFVLRGPEGARERAARCQRSGWRSPPAVHVHLRCSHDSMADTGTEAPASGKRAAERGAERGRGVKRSNAPPTASEEVDGQPACETGRRDLPCGSSSEGRTGVLLPEIRHWVPRARPSHQTSTILQDLLQETRLQAARFRLRRKLPSEVSRLSNEITKRRRKPKFSGA